MVDVSNKLLDRFADCLERTLAADQAPSAAAATVPAPVTAASAVPAPAALPAGAEAQRHTPDAIDLFETAGVAVLKRVLPAVGAAAVLLLLWRILHRLRS
jgi:uncharacterized protein